MTNHYSKFNRPYVKNVGQVFCPMYLPGEDYSFYFNSNEVISDSTSSGDYELYIIDWTNTQVASIGILSQLYIAGEVGYNFYINSFVFPNSVKDGYYHFQIWNGTTDTEMYRSNWIQVSSYCTDTTAKVRFRNNDQLYGVRYDLLPNFWQMFRLPINLIKPIDVKSTRDQYRQSSNGRDLRNSKSFRDLVVTLEMYWSNDDDFEALSAILEHTDIEIAGQKCMNMSQVKIEQPSEFSGQMKGTCEMIVQDYNIDYSDIHHYGDFILWGGNASNILTTFVQGNTD